MSLFETALQALSDEERKQFEEWERAAREVSRSAFKDAARTVVDNIRFEEHFYDRDSSRLEKFTTFLRKLVQSYSTFPVKGLTAEKFRDLYNTVCRDNESCLHGELIEAVNPKMLFRYVPMNGLLGSIAKMIDDDDIINRRRKDDVRRKNNFDLYQKRIFAEWKAYGREILAKASLANRKAVFVTFPDADGRIPDESIGAVILMRRLGYFMTQTDSIVKLAYEPQDEDILKFPTVADAGWYPYFKPAEEGDLHGWTEPIGDPTTKGYPEAVHRNRNIGLLVKRPRIIE